MPEELASLRSINGDDSDREVDTRKISSHFDESAGGTKIKIELHMGDTPQHESPNLI